MPRGLLTTVGRHGMTHNDRVVPGMPDMRAMTVLDIAAKHCHDIDKFAKWKCDTTLWHSYFHPLIVTHCTHSPHHFLWSLMAMSTNSTSENGSSAPIQASAPCGHGQTQATRKYHNRRRKVIPNSLAYSYSKNCPNVLMFCKDGSITHVVNFLK